MKKLLLLFVFVILSLVQVVIFFQDYMQGSGGKFCVEDGIVVVSKCVCDFKYFFFGVVMMGQILQGWFNWVGVFVFKDCLSVVEVELFVINVICIVSKCFNINLECGNVVVVWFICENQMLLWNIIRSFGLLDVIFVWSVIKDGNFFIVVYL